MQNEEQNLLLISNNKKETLISDLEFICVLTQNIFRKVSRVFLILFSVL